MSLRPNTPQKKFLSNIHPMLARYDTLCPDCQKRIFKDDPVIHLSDYKVTLHWNCFYKCNVLSFQKDLLSDRECLVLDPKLNIKTQFCLLVYRLNKKARRSCTKVPPVYSKKA